MTDTYRTLPSPDALAKLHERLERVEKLAPQVQKLRDEYTVSKSKYRHDTLVSFFTVSGIAGTIVGVVYLLMTWATMPQTPATPEQIQACALACGSYTPRVTADTCVCSQQPKLVAP